MFKKMGIVCVSVMLVLCFIGVVGCSKKKPERFEEKLGQMIDKISSSLDLSESQKVATVKIKEEILKRNEEKKSNFFADMKEAEEAFTKQIKSDKFNETELNKLMDTQTAKREEMRKFMISELAKFHAILTSEQRVKLVGILKEIGPGHRAGRRHEHKDKDSAKPGDKDTPKTPEQKK